MKAVTRLFESAVEIAHDLLTRVVGPGDTVVDCTAGNGKDTAFLAGLVGDAGTVYAFDIQDQALQNTRTRLETEGLLARVNLVAAGHENLDLHVSRGLKAAVFNLGFLPSGNKSLITRPSSTVTALEKAAELLNTGGLLVVVVYTGHRGGTEESSAVDSFFGGLPRVHWDVIRLVFPNRGSSPPYLISAQKRWRN